MAEEIILTKDGKKKLEDELDRLIHEVRPQVIEELKVARAQGDLSENADYDAARARQAEVESEIKKIQKMLDEGVVIEGSTSQTNNVQAGSNVTVENLETHKVATYQIRGSVEADPIHGIISNNSPMAKALLGHRVGETVQIAVAKPYSVKIVKID